MSRRTARSSVFGTRLVGVLLTLALVGFGVFSADAGAGPRSAPRQDVFYGMSLVSATDGWAVGQHAGTGSPKTLAYHWNGTSWVHVGTPSPASDFAFFTAASTFSADDAWAVGPAILDHWNGSAWKSADAPVANDYLLGVSADSPVDAWAVGHTGLIQPKHSVILHWDGLAWTPASYTDPGSRSAFASVSALTPADVWAVGSYGGGDRGYAGATPVAMHWDGVEWRKYLVPNVRPGAVLSSVSARAADDVWAVGSYGAGLGSRAFVVHWDGKSWKRFSTPSIASSDVSLSSVSARTAGNAWAVGSAYPKTLTMHWNGKDWATVDSPSPGGTGTGALLSGVSDTTSGGVWAVGDSGTPAGGANLLILRWNGREWRQR